MATVPNCKKGSYHPRPGGRFQVIFPLGFSEEKNGYDSYVETVADEAEAIALIKSINEYIYYGGSPKDIPAWRKGVEAQDTVASLTVSQFAEEFISMREKSKSVQARTVQSDRECFRRIEPYIGKIPLVALNPHDIDHAYACMRSDGPDNLNGYAYCGTSMQKTHAFLSMMLSKAVDYEYIDKNPCDKVEKPKRDTAEKRALSVAEARELFSQIESEPLTAKSVGVAVALMCGARESEVLALQWQDYEKGCIHITKSLEREKQTFKSTKNEDKRTVPCPSSLVALLERWKDRQKKWYEKNGLEWSPDAPIVHAKQGRFTSQRSYIRWFGKERLRYPIPDDFSFHGLRHTYTTLISRDCGIDSRTARSLTGHRTEEAFETYTHTDEAWRRKAAQRYGDLVVPNTGEKICQNCALWSASPLDDTKGACWADESNLHAGFAACQCESGDFQPRTTDGVTIS